MTIINVNSISGINSITAQGASGIEFYDSSGNLSGDITLGAGATIKGSSNLIRFDTGATIPVQVDGNGHIGIGTDNNTSAALDVHGDIRISRGSRGDGTGKIIFGSDNAGDYLQLQDIGTGGNIFELVQDGSKKVVVRGTNGHLGIGTDNPEGIIHTLASTNNHIVLESPDSNADIIGADTGGSTRIRSSGGQLSFYTGGDASAHNAANSSIAATINTSGNLAFSSGKGIDFHNYGSGSNITSNFLDDYEEGTFTPTLRDGGAGNAATVGLKTGTYVKIGHLCHMAIRLSQITSVAGMTSGNQIYICDLPFSIKSISSSSIYVGSCELSKFNVSTGTYQVAPFVNASSSDQSTFRIFESIDNSGHNSVKVSQIVPATDCEIFVNLVVPVV